MIANIEEVKESGDDGYNWHYLLIVIAGLFHLQLLQDCPQEHGKN